MPYAEVPVLVAAVVVAAVVVAVLLFVVVVATGVLDDGRTAGAELAVAAAVLLSGVVDTGRAGVAAAGVVASGVAAAGVVASGVAAAGVVLAAVTADGVETAGVGLAITDAAVTESEFVPPPPPHAASVVATRAERTRKVIVLVEVVMSIYSELRSVACCCRLFIVGLWNKSILIQGNRFHTEKVVFRQHNVAICNKNLPRFLLSLEDCYSLRYRIETIHRQILARLIHSSGGTAQCVCPYLPCHLRQASGLVRARKARQIGEADREDSKGQRARREAERYRVWQPTLKWLLKWLLNWLLKRGSVVERRTAVRRCVDGRCLPNPLLTSSGLICCLAVGDAGRDQAGRCADCGTAVRHIV